VPPDARRMSDRGRGHEGHDEADGRAAGGINQHTEPTDIPAPTLFWWRLTHITELITPGKKRRSAAEPVVVIGSGKVMSQKAYGEDKTNGRRDVFSSKESLWKELRRGKPCRNRPKLSVAVRHCNGIFALGVETQCKTPPLQAA